MYHHDGSSAPRPVSELSMLDLCNEATARTSDFYDLAAELDALTQDLQDCVDMCAWRHLPSLIVRLRKLQRKQLLRASRWMETYRLLATVMPQEIAHTRACDYEPEMHTNGRPK